MASPTNSKSPGAMDDWVANIIGEWRDRRPDLDYTPLEVVSRVQRAAHHLQAKTDEVAAAYGLSHSGDLDVLTNLHLAGPPHERTPSQLAEAQLVTTGGMTVRLNRLQKAGLIERRPNPRDGRGVLVRLTPLGEEIAADAFPRVMEIQTTGIRGLDDPQRVHLAGLLRELLVALGDIPAFRPAIVAQRNEE